MINHNQNSPPTSFSHRSRLALLDAVRGGAVVAMMVWHLLWNLWFSGLYPLPIFTDPLFWWFNRTIPAVFLFLVGFSQALSYSSAFTWPRALRRLGGIGAAALAVTGVTLVLLPHAFVFFGVLHCIFVASVVCLLLRRAPPLLVLILALVTGVLPWLATSAVFDPPAVMWIGLAERPRISVDFVPPLPWVAWALVGLAVGRWAFAAAPTQTYTLLSTGAAPAFAPILAPLRWLGRHALAVYLIHQPILFGAVMGVGQLR